MTVSSTAGIAEAWSTTRADPQNQALSLAMLKQQAKADQGVVALLETAADTAPPAPPGQGQQVDRRV
ncbi:MAG TPA: hypothetical protein VIL65_12250 [Beijerinckiaceae bacterium]|jgi:hypothetical protein